MPDAGQDEIIPPEIASTRIVMALERIAEELRARA